MQMRCTALRFFVMPAIAVLVGLTGVHAASAAEAGPAAEANYASILRTINPHLQIHQSRAYARSIIADAQRTKLDPSLIMALVTVESSWQPGAVSNHGARGLGQLMPTTAATLGVNPRDPSQNLRGAAAYLRTLVNRFANRGVNGMRYAIAGYNAGPRAVEQFHGIPPYHETQRYVVKVFSMWHNLSARIAKTFAEAPPQLAQEEPTEAQWLAHAGASALPVTEAAAPAVTPADSQAVPATQLP